MIRATLVLVGCLLAFPGRAGAAYILSNSDCPSSRGIQARLEGLVADQGPDSARAMVDVGEKEIRIELATYGERPRLRVLPNMGTCAEKTDAAALVIAAWLDALPQNTLAAPATLPRPLVPPPAPPPPTPLAPVAVVKSREGWIGVGGTAFRDGLAWGGAGQVGFAVDRLKGPLGARGAISLPWPRERTLGEGRARLLEPGVSLLGTWDLSRGAWRLSPALGVDATVLVVVGADYPKDRTSMAMRWSATGGARIARTWGNRQGWLELGVRYWPLAQSARQVRPDGSTQASLS